MKKILIFFFYILNSACLLQAADHTNGNIRVNSQEEILRNSSPYDRAFMQEIAPDIAGKCFSLDQLAGKVRGFLRKNYVGLAAQQSCDVYRESPQLLFFFLIPPHRVNDALSVFNGA